MAIAIPMLMLVLFGYALTLDVDNVPMVVWDQSRHPTSRELVSRFAGSRYFAVQGTVATYGELERAIDTAPGDGGPGDPARFRPADRGGPPCRGAADRRRQRLEHGHHRHRLRRGRRADATPQDVAAAQQLSARGGPPLRRPLDVRPRVWFNADLESRNYIIPGLIAVIMMVIAALLTSLTVAREWERGTMEQLISTPVKGPELILGKLVPYFADRHVRRAAGRADGRVRCSTCRCAAAWRCCSAWRPSS